MDESTAAQPDGDDSTPKPRKKARPQPRESYAGSAGLWELAGTELPSRQVLRSTSREGAGRSSSMDPHANLPKWAVILGMDLGFYAM